MVKLKQIKNHKIDAELSDLDRKNIDNRWVRLIGILLIGTSMPLIFFNNSDEIKLGVWVIISILLTFLVWEASRRIVAFLWIKYPWEKNAAVHIIISFCYLISLSLFLVLILYLIDYMFTGFSPDYWQAMKGVNVAMVLVTFFTTSIYEMIFLFTKWKKSLVLAASLEKETVLSQFEALKNQMNPHFLFNSLSVLESIIQTDQKKAVEFVSRFSKIYRYVLDVKDEIAVELKHEMDFVMAYVFLQKLRFGENLILINSIEKESLEKFVLPLSVQMLIENAIKHNEISNSSSLQITISNNKNGLIVTNNLSFVENDDSSTKIGLNNLIERYRLVSDLVPNFYVRDKNFVAEIPFFVTE